jgi:hypothetical protein
MMKGPTYKTFATARSDPFFRVFLEFFTGYAESVTVSVVERYSQFPSGPLFWILQLKKDQ